jgi:hypothetical protein
MLGAGQQHNPNEHGVSSPSGSSVLLARGQSSALSRLSSAISGAAAVDPNANSKQADMYITELLSYSLDRLRKVRQTGHLIAALFTDSMPWFCCPEVCPKCRAFEYCHPLNSPCCCLHTHLESGQQQPSRAALQVPGATAVH